MKIIKRTLVLVPLVLIGLIVALVIAINVSPKPFIYYLQHNAALNQAPKKPKQYNEYRAKVTVMRNRTYASKYKSSVLDIFYNKANKQRPTIVWAHGGGFVAGDKRGTDYWAMKMAASGYNVVSIDYSLAPDNHYPDQVNQMADAIRDVVKKYGRQLNIKQIIVGGDSAGAHISSQVIAAQFNPKLAKNLNYVPVIGTKIVGGLLYCGPYDIAKMVNVKNTNTMIKLFINQVGWAYLGKKNWQTSKFAKDVSTVKHVNNNFPPIFITDGNNGSFESQGKELYDELLDNDVPTRALFFSKKEKVNHEYQFDLDSKNAKRCFSETIGFLNGLVAGSNK